MIWINYRLAHYIDILIGVLNIFEIRLGKFSSQATIMQELILRGEAHENKAVTIKDVARLAERSIATVSQILNGHGDKFSAARLLCGSGPDELNYSPITLLNRMIKDQQNNWGPVPISGIPFW